MVQQVMGNLLCRVQQFILEDGRLDSLVKKVSYALKLFEIYVTFLKAKGKENIIVWMLFISKLSGFYFATYCIIQSKMLIVCLVFLFECWNYHDISHNHCPHSPLHSFLIRYKEICNHCSPVCNIFCLQVAKLRRRRLKMFMFRS